MYFPPRVVIEEKLIRQMVEQHGENNWTLISQVLKNAGVEIHQRDLEEKWYQLEPRRALQLFSKNQIQKILEIGFNVMGRKSKMMEQFATYSTGQTKIQIASVFLSTVKSGLLRMTRIFGRNKTEQRKFFNSMDIVDFKLFYRFSLVETEYQPKRLQNEQGLLIGSISLLAKDLKNLLWVFSKARYQNITKQKEMYRRIMNSRHFERLYQLMKYVNVLRNIANKTLTADEQLESNIKHEAYDKLFNTQEKQKYPGSILNVVLKQIIILTTAPQDKSIWEQFTEEWFKKFIDQLSQEFDSDIYKELIRQIDPENKLNEIFLRNPYLPRYIENQAKFLNLYRKCDSYKQEHQIQ